MRFLNTNKKKNIFVFFFAFLLAGVFLFEPQTAHAGWWSAIKDFGIVISNPIELTFKGLIYGFFVVSSMIAGLGFMLLTWSIDPQHVVDLFNNPAVYTLWQFIRDFFNLFFIFVLLYIAFTTVFQIQKNFKKALLSLVLAALFINFSFPISRALIDVTNVPMYFFTNSLQDDRGQQGAGVIASILGTSKIQNIILPNLQGTTTVQGLHATEFSSLFIAVIFMFLFGVTLLVFALQFVIRLIVLVVLVIFSPVGFAAPIIPGLETYSKMWWDNFWKYALFGPAGMLMLVVALRFLGEFSKQEQSFQSAAALASSGSDTSLFVAISMFSVVIIMLWIAIGLGQKMGLAGAAAISGKGEKFAKWVGKKTYDNPLGRGLGGGIKERAENNKFAQVFTPKYWKGPSSVEAGIKGGIAGVGTAQGVRGGARNELNKIRYKKALDDAEEYKKNRMAHSEAREKMAKGDAGAALYLAGDKGLSSAEDLVAATKATGHDRDMLAKVMNGAQDSAVGDLTDIQHASIQEAFYARDPKTGTVLRDPKDRNERAIDSTKQEAYAAYTVKLKKEGKLDVRVNHEIQARIDDVPGTTREAARDAVYAKRIATLDAEDLIKQTDLHKGTAGANLKAYYKSAIDRGEVSAQRIQKTIDKAVEKGKPEVQKMWLELGGSVSRQANKSARETAEEEWASVTKKP